MLDAGATRRENYVDLRQHRFAWFLDVVLDRRKVLANQRTDFLLQGLQGHARLDAPDQVEPTGPGIVHIRSIRQRRHGFDGQIEIRRCAHQAVAEEALRGNADDRDRARVHPEGAAKDGSVAGIVALPGLIAHHSRDGCALDVIRIHQQAACTREQTEGLEVIARDELAEHRASLGLRAVAPHGDWAESKSRLHRRQAFELRHILLQEFVSLSRKQGIVAVILGAGVHAAIVLIPEPYQGLGIAHWKVLQQHRIHQRKDGGVGADAQRQSEQRGSGETRSLAQFSQRVAHILEDCHSRRSQLGLAREF